jgi:predicted regulator of Ras-like GTPase activity (Roadblock/LC7/MglB family)
MQVEKPQTENDEYLQQKLRDLKDQEGIIGYILRGSKSAAIDLKDPKKIIEYAVLSSTIFDESQTMTDTLQLENIDTIVIESEDIKLLSMNLEDMRITIFMEKSVDHNKLYEDLK